MLSDQEPDDLRRRNEIISATESELRLLVNGRTQIAAWSAVTGVSAGRAKLDRISDIWIFVLAIEIELEDREHLFMVGETEPAWLSLTTILHAALPVIAPFEAWGPSLMTASAPLELYARPGHE